MILTPRFMAVFLTLGLAASSVAGCSSDSAESPAAPLRILVTNDDGVSALGIDAIVGALTADSDDEVTVCAPATERSGTGDTTDCGTLEGADAETASGYPATAVDGCPADAVNYALDPSNGLYMADSLPHVVISGINTGQNLGAPIISISGTVGAAKTAARDHGIPALASSQGLPEPDGEYDYPSGVEAVLAWLAEHRGALAVGTVTTTEIDSINIPSCAAGSMIRGTLEIAISETSTFQAQDCESDLANPQTDVEAFDNGYTTLSAVPAN